MSRKLFCVGAAITSLFVGGVVCGGDMPAPDVNKENAQLRQEVQHPKAQIDLLKAEIKVARAGQVRITLDRAAQAKQEEANRSLLLLRYMTTEPIQIAPLKTLPPGTVEKEFNGAPVYLIPVEGK